MTYKQLAIEISKMTQEQQGCDVTVGVNDENHEFYPVTTLYFSKAEEEDALDDNHPVLNI